MTSDQKRCDLEYALNKQVPSIAREANFETDYGYLRLTGTDALKVAALVRRLIEGKLKKM